MRKSRLLLAFVLLSVTPVFAWGNKEHIQLTRLAVLGLLEDPSTPPAMKAWLRQVQPDARDIEAEKQWFLQRSVGTRVQRPGDAVGPAYWSTVPDAQAAASPRDARVQPFDVPERLLHFVDLELLGDPVIGYRHDLSGRPPPRAIPRDIRDPRWRKAGMLPFRVVDAYDQLVDALRAGRLTESDGEENAVKWAGFLAHYLADNTQPHHATVDYRSQSYFANPQTAPNIHSAMEYRMGDDPQEPFADLREEYWSLLIDALEQARDPAADETDLWRATLVVAYAGYDALPLIGLAAMSAAGQGGTPDRPQGPNAPLDLRAFFHFRGDVDGRQMTVLELKARQSAWAVIRIQHLLRQAWDQAHP